MTDAPKTQDAADWSDLPRDMYVVRAWKPDGLFWCAEVAQVPHALAPEVRYVRATPLPADDAEMVERVGRRLCAEKCAFYGDPPCWKMAEDEGLDWTGGAATAARCDEDCMALARAALSAMRGEP